MPILLCGIGVFALVAGLVMVGFGIPINEFSFGNTLISAGTTAIIGGLIIIALAATVGQLRRIAQLLAQQPVAGIAQRDHHEVADLAASNPPMPSARLPARPRVELPPESAISHPVNAAPSGLGGEMRHEFGAAPLLRNPEETPLAVDDEISLSPPHPVNTPQTMPDLVARQRPAGPVSFGAPVQNQDGRLPETPTARRAPMPSAPLNAPFAGSAQPRPQQAARFDAMWPAEAKAAKPAVVPDSKPESTFGGGILKRNEVEAQKPRAVAVLKSGVVDGMGYTLYVDGSIEAELPQGTLRFASINELRSHLEKHS
jgi:hypothetical protein